MWQSRANPENQPRDRYMDSVTYHAVNRAKIILDISDPVLDGGVYLLGGHDSPRALAIAFLAARID